MIRRLAALLLLAACVSAPHRRSASPGPASGSVAEGGVKVATLVERIDALAGAPPFEHALWGIVVEDDAGLRLYGRNAATLFIPASNRKLFSAATVASCLGFERQLSTDFFLSGNDLVIRGGGDPSFGGRWLFDRDALFAPVVDALRARAITAVAGDVVADVSAFDRTTVPPQWEIEDFGSAYAPPVDALAYNENVVGIDIADCARPVVDTDPLFVDATANVACADAGEATIAADPLNRITISGTLPSRFHSLNSIATPGLYAAQALAAALKHAGIPVRGRLRVEGKRLPLPAAPIASIASPPMWQLLSVELKPSQNLYAEMLYKDLGLGAPASYAIAQEAERRFLVDEVGADPAEFRFVDGSGVSATNYVAPEAAVKVLRWMDHPARRGAWWLILATPGEEGTLHRRLTELAQRLRGKTGTLTGVGSLSGIVRGTNGGTRYFTIFLNHYAATSADAQRVIDAIAREVAAF